MLEFGHDTQEVRQTPVREKIAFQTRPKTYSKSHIIPVCFRPLMKNGTKKLAAFFSEMAQQALLTI